MAAKIAKTGKVSRSRIPGQAYLCQVVRRNLCVRATTSSKPIYLDLGKSAINRLTAGSVNFLKILRKFLKFWPLPILFSRKIEKSRSPLNRRTRSAGPLWAGPRFFLKEGVFRPQRGRKSWRNSPFGLKTERVSCEIRF